MAPKINLEQERFFITVEEFNSRVKEISGEQWRIKDFARFAIANYRKISDRCLMCGDIKLFCNFLETFLDKELVNPC